MDDRTETLDSDETGSYEWDYEEAIDRPPRILWGRIIAFAVFLALAFWLGRSSAPSESASAELGDLRQELTDAREEIESLESQLATQAQAQPTSQPTTESSPVATGEERTYVVKEGDTLLGIALEFYNDGSIEFRNLIIEANDIADPSQLSVGQELIIPPAPEE
jgi:nucleoid-associated protein YgaU